MNPTDPAEMTVIGAGLLGLCSAHYLNEAGFRVRVIERRAGPGLETSFANAGMATPSMSDPWNAPGVHRTLLRYLGRADAPLLVRPAALPQYLAWGLRFLRFSQPRLFNAAMQANFRLSAFSVKQIRELRESLGLAYEHRSAGTLKVFRDSAGLESALRDSEKLHGFGLRYAPLDRAQTVALEPVLADNDADIVGSIHYPDDETGDAHLFCQALHRALESRGVEFRFGQEVSAIETDGGRVAALRLGSQRQPTGAVVVAAAGWSPRLLAGTGVRVAVKPVKGYSVTAPLTRPELMPARSIIDSKFHAAVTPLASRLRLAGTAEFAGWSPRLDPRRLAGLWQMLETVSPALAAATDRAQATNWCGFRPMSADGNPYIGPGPVAGLYLNTGHGYLGWTQCAGSGALLAAIVRGDELPVDPRPYRVGRA